MPCWFVYPTSFDQRLADSPQLDGLEHRTLDVYFQLRLGVGETTCQLLEIVSQACGEQIHHIFEGVT